MVATANQRDTPSSLLGRASASSNMVLIVSQTASIAVGLVDLVGYDPLLVAVAIVISVPAVARVTRPATVVPAAALKEGSAGPFRAARLSAHQL